MSKPAEKTAVSKHDTGYSIYSNADNSLQPKPPHQENIPDAVLIPLSSTTGENVK